jgi:hypothetical protein
MNRKRGQQEIVGFVLIVVLVIIGLMVFLIISSRSGGDDVKTVEVGNMLDALMKHTTDCAVVYEPDYDDFEDLFKSCHQGDQCSNLGMSACDYLNESLRAVLEGMFATEATIEAYQIDFSVKEEEESTGLLQIVHGGNCTGSVSAAQRSVVSHSDSLVIRMKTCIDLS